MIDVKNYVGDLEIIFTGKAHLLHNKILSIHLTDRKIEVSYVVDQNIESKINWSLKDNVLKLIFENYTNEFGGGILQPWGIGQYNGRELFMTIYSILIDDGTSKYVLCDYILYNGKEVGNE